MNSSLTGVATTLTVAPDLLVNVRLLIVTINDDSWSFAVLDARTVTDVFPVKVV